MPHLSPAQRERLQVARNSSLFQYLLQGDPLEADGLDPEAKSLTFKVPSDRQDLSGLGLMPLSGFSRLMEDAVLLLGYLLTGELLMVTRLAADYERAVGIDELLEITARQTKRQGRFQWYELSIRNGAHEVTCAQMTAIVIRTFPEALQQKIVKAAEHGRVDPGLLMQFVHLFQPQYYMAAKVSAQSSEEAAQV